MPEASLLDVHCLLCLISCGHDHVGHNGLPHTALALSATGSNHTLAAAHP